jgi:hypothetical protein
MCFGVEPPPTWCSKTLDGRQRLTSLTRDERKIDTRHIFPRQWCEDMNIPPKVFNSIVNETAVPKEANRMIGGKAPSNCQAQIPPHAQVLHHGAPMDLVLRSHLVDPSELRADRFEQFYQVRNVALE